MARSGNGTGNGASKGKGGRPRLEFDLDLVRRGGTLLESNRALARRLGCSAFTVADRKATDPEFSRAYDDGAADRETSLRTTALRLAVGSRAEYDGEGNLLRAEQRPSVKVLIRLLECELGYVARKSLEVEHHLPEDPEKMTAKEAEAFLEKELGSTLAERMSPPVVH